MTFKTCLTYSLLLLTLAGCTDVAFDSETWQDWEENETNMFERWDMVDDLIDNYELEGKSIRQINQLLGVSKADCPNKNCVIYYNLGPCRSGIDYGSLSLTFKNDEVIDLKKYCN